MNDVLVSVDPRFAPEHATYYLRGLLRHTDAHELPLAKEGFPRTYTDDQPLAFVLRRGAAQRKFYISAGDRPEYDAAALEWADLYGKVNVAPEYLPASHQDKVLPIGPSHALKIWDLRTSALMAVRTYRRGGRLTGSREHFRRFWLAYSRRVDDEFYDPQPSSDGYVFYNSWLWKKHSDVNPPRAEFVRVCQELRNLGVIRFEGGFTARRRGDMPEYDDVTAARKFSLSEYLKRLKRSAVVFNTPAVHKCFGWKLGEFLRLGKAIISMPLSRVTPAPLVHGEHLHIVDGSRESIRDAILRLIEDTEYRRRLEQATRGYWLEYLAPEVVIRRAADAAFGDPRARQDVSH